MQSVAPFRLSANCAAKLNFLSYFVTILILFLFLFLFLFSLSLSNSLSVSQSSSMCLYLPLGLTSTHNVLRRATCVRVPIITGKQ